MAVGLPVKANYAAGDILTATNMNDLSGTFNNVATSYGNAAGKNKIINGDFRINQRSFTSNTTSASFNFDRWAQLNTGGTFTVTPQTFTTGSAPVAGYEGSTYLQGITAGQSAAGDRGVFRQKIESVRTFAGQTATISFWAKAATGTPKIGIELAQDFGAGGSPSAYNSVPVSAVTISASWVRYTATIAIPSLTGKTIGTSGDALDVFLWVSAGSDFATRASSIGIQNNTFQIWGVQLEAGSIASPFQTASGGSIQSELAMCQRYYQKSYPAATVPGAYFPGGYSLTIVENNIPSNNYYHYQPLIVQMRTDPSVTIYSGSGATTRVSTTGGGDLAANSAVAALIADNHFSIQNSSGGALTASAGGFLFFYVASAEL